MIRLKVLGGKIISKIIDNFSFPTWWEIIFAGVLLITAIFVAVKAKKQSLIKRILLPIFTLYICLVVGITILYRIPFASVQYNMDLFWSYKKASTSRKLLIEIVLNYLMLLPFGIMMPVYVKRRWAIVYAILFSTGVEVTQYLMMRGLFEFDDIIGNTVGAIAGVGLYSLFRIVHGRHNTGITR